MRLDDGGGVIFYRLTDSLLPDQVMSWVNELAGVRVD